MPMQVGGPAFEIGRGSFALGSNFRRIPPWVLAGADLDFDFANGRYFQATRPNGFNPSQLLTVSRASTGYAADTSGNYTSFANNVARITNQGLLVEEARTNSIRNNSMQGAVLGTPGTLPTNWAIALGSGISQQITGVGTEAGIDYIEVIFSGTLGTTGSAVTLRFEAGNNIAAVQNQTWATSLFARVVAGSLPAPLQLLIRQSDSGGSTLSTDTVGSTFSPTSASLGAQRFSASEALSNASVAFTTALIGTSSVNSGTAVNFTLRIGWPQLELGAFATSPIRTTNAAVTRAADVVAVTTPPVFGSAYTLFAKGTPQAPTNYGTPQFLLVISDGSASNEFALHRLSSTGNARFRNASGGSANTNTGAVWSQNVIGNLAGSDIASSQVVSFNGGAVFTGSGSFPIGVNKLNIGSDRTGSEQWNGYISEISVFANTAQPTAQLQAFGSR